MPSSTLVELELEVWVEVEVGAWVKMQFSFLTFSVRWVGGWVGGEMEIKAYISLSLVEVEAELGNFYGFCHNQNQPSLCLKMV